MEIGLGLVEYRSGLGMWLGSGLDLEQELRLLNLILELEPGLELGPWARPTFGLGIGLGPEMGIGV